MKGFSPQNLWYMRQFSFEYQDDPIVQQLVGEIPWGHNIKIMTRIKEPNTKIWYIKQTIEHGWSRNILTLQIDTNLYERQGKTLTNSKQTLPSITSDLAQQIFKNEYNLEFLGVGSEIAERQLERKLVDHIRDFLLELGTGFAFMGSQYKLTVGGDVLYGSIILPHQTKLLCGS